MNSEQKPSDQPQAPVRSQEPLVRRSYRVAQAQTADGLQAIVNNLLCAGFEPIGGISVVKTGVYQDRNGFDCPIVLHTQALFYSSNPAVEGRREPTTDPKKG